MKSKTFDTKSNHGEHRALSRREIDIQHDRYRKASVNEREGLRASAVKRDRRGKRVWPGKKRVLIADLAAHLRAVGNLAMGGARVISFATKRDRWIILRSCMSILHDRGFEVRAIKNLDRRHFEQLIKDMLEKEQSASTIANKVSTLRWLYRSLGKDNLVENIEDCFPDGDPRHRSLRATSDHSIEAAGADPNELVEQAKMLNERFSICLELSFRFGLRAQESWLFRPHVDATETQLYIRKGTKGGRMRDYQCPLDDADRELLRRACAVAKHKHASIIPIGMSKKRWRNNYYYWAAKIGLTKKALGVTSHGFRHSRLQREYKETAGVDAPIKNPTIVVDPELEAIARQRVSEMAGHNRPAVSSAYIG